MAVGVIVTALLARYLGPSQFGVLNYAIAFVGLFASVTTLGLEKLVVKKLVSEPEARASVLGTAFALRFAAAILAYALALGAIAWLRPPTDPVVALIVVIGVGLAFQPTDVIAYFFDSRIQSRTVVVARNIAFLMASGVRIAMVLLGASLLAFAGALALEALLAAAALVCAFRATGMRLSTWRFERTRAQELLRQSWPLALAGIAVMVYMRVDIVMLGELSAEREVGIYSAAVRISELCYFLPMAVLTSVYPWLIEAKHDGKERYELALRQIYSILLWFAILVAIAGSAFANEIVALIYGQEFLSAASVLRIHIWATVPVFLGVAISHHLLVEDLQYLSLLRTCIGAVVNVVLNTILIPMHGAQGAAISALVSQLAVLCSIGAFAQSRHQISILVTALNPAVAARGLAYALKRMFGD